MSGPTAVVITGEPISTLVSAAAIRAAQAIAEGYERAAEMREKHAVSRKARDAAQAAARRQGQEALEKEVEAAEERLDRLVALAARLDSAQRVRATRPARPAGSDPVALAAYAQGLHGFADDLEAIVLTETAIRRQHLETDVPDLRVPAAARRPAPERASQRLLSRIAHLGPPPPEIENLARELDGILPGERADLLATELARRIQLHVEEVQRRNVEEATATVVRQSLRELGYEVEDIAETLFVEGGILHFTRPGWGDYMVRMRVEPRGAAANFNVVRAVDAGGNERSAMDHLAEDRWCAEFPALLKALEARGVRVGVTRRVEAGELPVQQVERSKLPKFAEEEDRAPATKPFARDRK